MRSPAANTGFASGGVSYKLGALCLCSTSVLDKSIELRKEHECKAQKH
jgi:hypothetical protein